jgi:hypothetical protein
MQALRETCALQRAGHGRIVDGGSGAGGRGAGPGVLDDLPGAVGLALVDDEVAAFGGDFGSGGDVGESLLEVAAVVGQNAGRFEVLAVESEVAVEGGHDVLKESAEGGRAGDAVAVGLQEDGVGSVELEHGLELLGAKVLNPGFAEFGESDDGGGLRSGGGGAGKSWSEDGGEGENGDGGAARVAER